MLVRASWIETWPDKERTTASTGSMLVRASWIETPLFSTVFRKPFVDAREGVVD